MSSQLLTKAALVHFLLSGRRKSCSNAAAATIADGATPPFMRRLAFCSAIAFATAVYVFFFWGKPQSRPSDFAQIISRIVDTQHLIQTRSLDAQAALDLNLGAAEMPDSASPDSGDRKAATEGGE